MFYTFFMKNYAKFCKLNIQNKTYQLNLTEGGFDGTNFIDKTFSVLRYLAPTCSLYCILKFAHLSAFGIKNASLITYSLLTLAITCGTFLPHTTFGNVFNSIHKNRIYTKKIKEYYEKMRDFEIFKTKTKLEKRKFVFEKEQQKLTKKMLKYFEKQTTKFEHLTKRYYKIKEKNCYVDGLKGMAFDSLETRQETIDKFLFHNAKLLIALCPEYKDFIAKRARLRIENIVSGEPYYDEYVWSALEGENLIKNNCLNKKDTSNYIENLGKLLLAKKENNEIEYEKLSIPEKTLEDLKTENLYKNTEILNEKMQKIDKILNIFSENNSKKLQENVENSQKNESKKNESETSNERKKSAGSLESIYKTK